MCFLNDTATTEIYTLSQDDALPISQLAAAVLVAAMFLQVVAVFVTPLGPGGELSDGVFLLRTWPTVLMAAGPRLQQLQDRKSTRLNSSHANISYAVFCLKKKQVCAV